MSRLQKHVVKLRQKNIEAAAAIIKFTLSPAIPLRKFLLSMKSDLGWLMIDSIPALRPKRFLAFCFS